MEVGIDWHANLEGVTRDGVAAGKKEMEVLLPGGSRCSRPEGGSWRGIMPGRISRIVAVTGRAELEGAELEGAELEGAETEGAEMVEGVEFDGPEPGCAAPGGRLTLAEARGVGFCCRLAMVWKKGRPRLSLGGGGGGWPPLVGASWI